MKGLRNHLSKNRNFSRISGMKILKFVQNLKFSNILIFKFSMLIHKTVSRVKLPSPPSLNLKSAKIC